MTSWSPVRRTTLVLLLVAAFAFPAGDASAKEQSATLSGDVAAGDTYTTRLRNLPRGATLSLRVMVDGQIRILLLGRSDFLRWPTPERPLFEGETSDKLGVSVRVPDSGNYFIVLDNRDGAKERSFTIRVRAATGGDASGSGADRMETELGRITENLRQIFVFDDLRVRAARCGTANAFSTPNSVVICAELARTLLDQIGDETKAQEALMFAVLHEIGHVLLRQWGYPFYDNEEVADEFATMLMVLSGRTKGARSQAEYFASLPSDAEIRRKRKHFDRHPLSVQRARNILHWLNQPDFVERWQKVLVPHMQTSLLRRLENEPQPWTNLEMVRQELAERASNGQP